MSERPSIEDLGALAELPADDPRRRTAEADPRVAALLRAYGAFVAPGPLPDGADLAAAEAHLLAALERELGVPLGDAARSPVPLPAAPAARSGHEPQGNGGTNFFAWLLGPALRPGLAAAAALLVVAAAWSLLAPRGTGRDSGRDAPNLRGPATPGAPGTWDARPAVRAIGPGPGTAGAVRLTWAPAPGATRYAVVFLAGDLGEIARVDTGTTTEFELAAPALPAGLASGQAVLWRVTAYQGADEIGRSDTLPLTIP